MTTMYCDPATCPICAEEVAEAYCMGTLGADAYAAFESHILGCPKCLDAVEAARTFVSAVRTAARRERSELDNRS
jgi:hypothetical protein